MTVGTLLVELRTRGLRLQPLAGGDLWVGPRARVTDDLRVALRAHKPELLGLLADLGTLHEDGTAAQLAELYAGLTPDERLRLLDEARTDRLAALLVLVVEAGGAA